MIRAYPEQPSPRAGERVRLHVSTDAPQFRVEFHRYGATVQHVASSEWLPGVDAPAHLPYQDWGVPNVGLQGEGLQPWPVYEFELDGRPGVYVTVLVEGDGDGRDRLPPPAPVAGLDSSQVGAPEQWVDEREARALLVLRPASPAAPVLFKLPLLTYHAYDVVAPGLYGDVPSWCFYNHVDLPIDVPAGLSLHRPGGGSGGWPYDVGNFDPFDATPRQTFAHWDARMVRWLETEGYDVDYCTDLDLHRDGRALLEPHRVLVSCGHDEYWSAEMRDAVEGWVDAGGNAAFFSGNTCWWRVVFSDPLTFARTQQWHEYGRPENAMVGVSFRNGGERDRDDHPVRVGYRVQHADHWVYDGTGLRDGDVIGTEEYLIGYECDGASFDRSARGPAVPLLHDGTPDTFRILAVGDCRPSGWGFGNGAATMGVFTRGRGTVFTGSTTDWPRVLTAGGPSSGVVEEITRNVLDRLS